MLKTRLNFAEGAQIRPSRAVNWLSRDGAEDCARAIETFWHQRGHAGVKCSVHEASETAGRFHVRSNLVNGKPPRVSA